MTVRTGFNAEHLAAKKRLEQARIDPRMSAHIAQKKVDAVATETLRKELMPEKAA